MSRCVPSPKVVTGRRSCIPPQSVWNALQALVLAVSVCYMHMQATAADTRAAALAACSIAEQHLLCAIIHAPETGVEKAMSACEGHLPDL